MTENKEFNLEQYLSSGIENIVKNAIKATFKNPRESLFLTRYANSAKQAAVRRHELECEGEHIPSLLIASITQRCNLRCTGCYANVNKSCESDIMTALEWRKIFGEADHLGVSMILLAGGEPLMRKDVIRIAAGIPGIIFPVFTNGTMFDDTYHQLFDSYRNLVPIISIEGDETATDTRRGAGIYAKTQEVMKTLRENNLLFGASITVTTENLEYATRESFLQDLHDKGCRVVLFIEYVPVDERDVALHPEQTAILAERVTTLRQSCEEMILISFPGDEKETGGCLAAGRGFIHINAAGGAEPCPFSPYSDTNVREQGLRNALKSPLFTKLKDTGILQQEHNGGCVLFNRRDEVQQLVP